MTICNINFSSLSIRTEMWFVRDLTALNKLEGIKATNYIFLTQSGATMTNKYYIINNNAVAKEDHES